MLCLHCGNIKPYSHKGYCEECYQNVVAENIKLKCRVQELEEQLHIKHKPKHMKE